MLANARTGMSILSLLKPNFSEVSTILSRVTLSPRLAKTELHETSSALLRLAFSQPLAWLTISVRVPGRKYGSGVSVGALTSETTPCSSAAAAVTTLNVEPGG